jgi:hypothetical protein
VSDRYHNRSIILAVENDCMGEPPEKNATEFRFFFVPLNREVRRAVEALFDGFNRTLQLEEAVQRS